MPAPKKPPPRARVKPSLGRSLGKNKVGSVGESKVADALTQEAARAVIETGTKVITEAAATVLPSVSRGSGLRRARKAAQDYAQVGAGLRSARIG